jgi:hypothetical protein
MVLARVLDILAGSTSRVLEGLVWENGAVDPRVRIYRMDPRDVWPLKRDLARRFCRL